MFRETLKSLTTVAATGLALTVAALGINPQPAHAQFGFGPGAPAGGGILFTIGPDGVQFDRLPRHRPGAPPGFRRPGHGDGPGHRPDHGIRPNFIGETGIVQVRQNNRRQWHRVALRQSYSNPVVILGPLSRNGRDPATVSVGRIGPRGFELRIEEWAYLDGAHAPETIGYMVVEAGRHELPGGDILTAGVARNIDEGWSRVRIGRHFDSTPVILTTVLRRGRGLPVVSRIRNVNRNGFGVRVQKEEAARELVRAPRDVAWVAIEPGRGLRDQLPYLTDTTPARVDENGIVLRLRRPGIAARLPVLLASMQTTNGRDTAALRYTRGGRGVRLFVEEERSADRETDHTNEKVGYALFGVGFIEAATPHGRHYIGRGGGRGHDDHGRDGRFTRRDGAGPDGRFDRPDGGFAGGDGRTGRGDRDGRRGRRWGGGSSGPDAGFFAGP